MSEFKVNYDLDNDILYLSFGDPKPSYSENFDKGVYLRKDMNTDELTGITIMDFSKRTKELQNLNFPGNVTFEELTASLN